uniref:Uncharacterized protein n=1 Tax=Rhizophora mucronata TaxID=61149 RepID=A0A2P2Q089_RHIMU
MGRAPQNHFQFLAVARVQSQ